MQRLVYTVDIDEDFDMIGDSFFELLDATVQEELGCNVVRSKLETPDEVMSRGDWEGMVEQLDTYIVKIVKESCIGLDLLGRTITHKTNGEGVVVGYSSISGEPFAFFYNEQNVSDRVCCFGHDEIIFVQ